MYEGSPKEGGRERRRREQGRGEEREGEGEGEKEKEGEREAESLGWLTWYGLDSLTMAVSHRRGREPGGCSVHAAEFLCCSSLVLKA